MRIDATDIARTFGRQTRAYAEYRIFSRLARFSEGVRAATVALTPADRTGAVVCLVTVGLEDGTPVRVTARGRHAYDAIDRVAHRIGPALKRRSPQAEPSWQGAR